MLQLWPGRGEVGLARTCLRHRPLLLASLLEFSLARLVLQYFHRLSASSVNNIQYLISDLASCLHTCLS